MAFGHFFIKSMLWLLVVLLVLQAGRAAFNKELAITWRFFDGLLWMVPICATLYALADTFWIDPLLRELKPHWQAYAGTMVTQNGTRGYHEPLAGIFTALIATLSITLLYIRTKAVDRASKNQGRQLDLLQKDHTITRQIEMADLLDEESRSKRLLGLLSLKHRLEELERQEGQERTDDAGIDKEMIGVLVLAMLKSRAKRTMTTSSLLDNRGNRVDINTGLSLLLHAKDWALGPEDETAGKLSLTGMDFSHVTLTPPPGRTIVFRNIDFSATFFHSATLDNAVFLDCTLTCADFRYASLKKTLFLRTALSGTRFAPTKREALEGACFIEPTFDEIACTTLHAVEKRILAKAKMAVVVAQAKVAAKKADVAALEAKIAEEAAKKAANDEVKKAEAQTKKAEAEKADKAKKAAKAKVAALTAAEVAEEVAKSAETEEEVKAAAKRKEVKAAAKEAAKAAKKAKKAAAAVLEAAGDSAADDVEAAKAAAAALEAAEKVLKWAEAAKKSANEWPATFTGIDMTRLKFDKDGHGKYLGNLGALIKNSVSEPEEMEPEEVEEVKTKWGVA
ncbi:MAG: hypothetical protein HQL50_09915 [Magnetococcales bacterium]|nr:hypothetical protein [Magnetococcales bacterium]